MGVGSAIPNAITSRKTDRGNAKVCNIDPAVIAPYITWEKMKNEQHKRLLVKQLRLVRNYERPFEHEGRIATAMQCATTMMDLAQQFVSCIFAYKLVWFLHSTLTIIISRICI